MVQLKILGLFMNFIRTTKVKKPKSDKDVVFRIDGDVLSAKIKDYDGI